MKTLKERLDALAGSKLYWACFATIVTVWMFIHPFKDKQPEMAFWIAIAVLSPLLVQTLANWWAYRKGRR